MSSFDDYRKYLNDGKIMSSEEMSAEELENESTLNFNTNEESKKMQRAQDEAIATLKGKKKNKKGKSDPLSGHHHNFY